MKIGKYVIERADVYNVAVSEVTVNQTTFKEGLKNVGYYRDWESALNKVLSMGIVSMEAAEILSDIALAKKEILKAIKTQGFK